MASPNPTLLKELGAAARAVVRKAEEADTEAWLKAGLPRGHGLPEPAVMAGQMVALKELLLLVLQAQRDRYVAYIKEHPPALAPVSKEAIQELPPQATLTHHFWLDGVTVRREWWNDETRNFEVDKRELASALEGSLEESAGIAGVAAQKASGGYSPGFASLTQTQAKRLLKEIGSYKTSTDSAAKAIYQAVADRAADISMRAGVLRDGAGRLVAAVSYTVEKETLQVAHLGALETQVPGTGVQVVRELSALAAKGGRSIVLRAPAEARAFFSGLGFAAEAKGRFSLAAPAASEMAQSPPVLGPAWTRVGWLEGPEATLSVAEGPVLTLKAADGTVLATAQYHLPEGEGNLILDSLAVSPEAPAGASRRMMREISSVAAKEKRGITVDQPTSTNLGFYQRIGMSASGQTLVFSATEAAAFASGLTGTTSFGGQISWDLAVAGASDYLRGVQIKGIVDQVTTATHQALVGTLADGVNRGQSVQDIASRVQHLDSAFGPARAETIARTETLTALSVGNYQAGKDAGGDEHEWRARVGDPRTRPWHAEAHGQRVPYDQPFIVNNAKGIPERLMFPRDPSASASNRINCRCDQRIIRKGVSDDPALGLDQHGLANVKRAPGLVVAGT